MCAKGLEPFDEDLSRHVQSLAERSDQLTEEVITYRKTLPARRAQAMQRRAQIVKQLEDKREAQRRKLEKQKADKVAASLPEMSGMFSIHSRPQPSHTHTDRVDAQSTHTVDLQRKDQVKRTLDQSVKDITGLQVVSIPLVSRAFIPSGSFSWRLCSLFPSRSPSLNKLRPLRNRLDW